MRWLLILFLCGWSWAAEVKPYFKDITAQIVLAISKANQCILVQAYSFTSEPILEALQNAQARGVIVRVILDKGQKHSPCLQFLPGTRMDRKHSIAHNKVIIIDDSLGITGSFNFTSAAEHRNAENAVFIQDMEVAKEYTTNWTAHFQHSEAP